MADFNELLAMNGLTEEDVHSNATDIAEEAYLKAEYNSILLEMIMEDMTYDL